MSYRFAGRMGRIPESFLDELFRVSGAPGVITFAGGLPASAYIDVAGIREAACEVFDEMGSKALQYTTTDGYLPLREFIADRYRQRLGLPARPEEIQIVNGSQQCLDLVAKIFLDPGDAVGMERPGYLGAIEAFSLYEPVFHAVPLEEDGPDLAAFASLVRDYAPKFFYGIPNSQNPSGRTYSQDKRRGIAEILDGTDTVFYEDDAFGELFFDGRPRLPVKRYLPEQTVMTGSFSKIVAPGMRIGWIYAPEPILQEFNVAKQAADLHSNFLSQVILHRYLVTHDLDAHVRRVAAVYGERCRLVCDLLDDLMPPGMTHTTPEGGMFMTATLPDGLSSMEVFYEGIKEGVAVLPGVPFYVDGGGEDTIRLNFSAACEEEIVEGMHRLARVVRRLE
ncbi:MULTISPECIES: PLP-dependent aminotransferase family protein [Methanoculleus]|jgi:2-aminoadipate transaminase|uniref:2-aminoadipate transaminase n=1 Tax=Methanoculleus thermophilus TaxID=2200 RepID=A0A1G8XXX9_9EURY|nr:MULTISPECIES: PLP-dependent aminotransferase family protein [Methanoculleus]NLN09316.1 PLP-dependent aminotransferase family protein [Methanoculleus thermophilus]SDJ95449.1 2-aminoadipate transaminase [Methanoculleus thermophilus]HQD26672.1 PLP-dependent aminotransferase family protein [Methanoculleus thermophilus]